MTILLTGAAGFIGFHTALALLQADETVIGIDNLNDYYDVSLKEARLAQLKTQTQFTFYQQDICDREALETLFKTHQPTHVIHLAAQAGVRYSLTHPQVYIDANLQGFCNVLEACRHHHIDHLVFASTSSVYGLNGHQPFSEHTGTAHPVSLYAATKKANELMAHSYAHLFQVPCTGLRFFTVYGPWGRPDMALFKFTKAILAGERIDVYNHGDLKRDFTYVDDIVKGVLKVLAKPPTHNNNWNMMHPDPAFSQAPYRIYNIGHGKPIPLMTYIEAIEKALNKIAQKNFLPMQAGDVYATYADLSDLERDFNYRPDTPIETGIRRFIDWYQTYYQC